MIYVNTLRFADIVVGFMFKTVGVMTGLRFVIGHAFIGAGPCQIGVEFGVGNIGTCHDIIIQASLVVWHIYLQAVIIKIITVVRIA